jgi:uncharacterized membrane protein YccC
VHIAAATWIFGAAAYAQGAERLVGTLTAIAFAAVSFAGPFIGQQNAPKALGPAGLLLITWLVLVGMRLGRLRPAAS